MPDDLPQDRIAAWTILEPAECAWTPLIPTPGEGALDFSDPDNSGLLPAL